MKPAELPRLSRASRRRYTALARSVEERRSTQVIALTRGIVSLALLLLAGTARAQAAVSSAEESLPIELDWAAPVECATSAQVREELRRLVQSRPSRGTPRLKVVARVEPDEGGYRAALDLSGAHGTTHREFRSRSCAAVERAATLSIALSLGEGDALGETAPHAEPNELSDEPPPPKLQASAAKPAMPAASIGSKRTSRTLALAPGLAWSPNWLGGNALGVQEAASLRAGHAVFSWQNRAWFPRSVHATDSAGARFWSLASSIEFSLNYRLHLIDLEFGLAFEAALLRGSGWGISSPARSWAPSYSAVPTFALAFDLRPGVRVAVSEELAVALARPSFEIEPLGEVYRVPPLTAITAVSVPFGLTSF